MPNFNITTILGYSLKKEYSGTMNYRNVITIDVEALFKTTESSVYDNILPIPADYVNPEVYQNSLTPISLNNNGFGNNGFGNNGFNNNHYEIFCNNCGKNWDGSN